MEFQNWNEKILKKSSPLLFSEIVWFLYASILFFVLCLRPNDISDQVFFVDPFEDWWLAETFYESLFCLSCGSIVYFLSVIFIACGAHKTLMKKNFGKLWRTAGRTWLSYQQKLHVAKRQIDDVLLKQMTPNSISYIAHLVIPHFLLFISMVWFFPNSRFLFEWSFDYSWWSFLVILIQGCPFQFRWMSNYQY